MELENVLTLTTHDFAFTIPRQKFIVVLFHDPDRTFFLDFVYEFGRAAKLLAKHNHHQTAAAPVPAPAVKVNLGVVDKYMVPRDFEGMVRCFNKLTDTLPPSIQFNSFHDITNHNNNNILIVVVFPHFFGDEYDNFLEVAETFNWDFDFYRTNTHEDPHVVKLFNSLKDNERYEDTQKNTSPLVTLCGVHPPIFIEKFFYTQWENDKAMLFINLFGVHGHDFESRYYQLANKYNDISFMLGDNENRKEALLNLYRSTGGEFEERADILNHVATHFIHNADVFIAKLDETRNDIRNENPGDLRTREGGPTLYFITPEENIKVYSEEFTKEGIINFITTI
ncbi:hypothetical protein ACFE04_001388 [Oxalis oulophora]